MDHSEMLPDEMLLRVFERLPLDALLQARAVCRRWRGVALDPGAWRHRALSCNSSCPDRRLAQAALRVAPRLRSLTIYEKVTDLPDTALLQSASRTECAFEEVTLTFIHDNESSSMERVLQRQVQLGAGVLRRVALKCVPSVRAVHLLQLALRANLEELELTHRGCYNRQLPTAVLSYEAASGKASLKVLRYDSSFQVSSEPPLVLQPLLRAHTATLESVAVLSKWFGGNERLLASCPQLRCLELGVCAENFRVLAALPAAQITDLILSRAIGTTIIEWEDFVPFFRKATQFRRLSLPRDDGAIRDTGLMSVLRALAESRSASLEELSVGNLWRLSWGELLAALQGLPQLRALSMTVPPDGDPLERTRTAELPSLRVLRIGKACVLLIDVQGRARVRCGLVALHSLVRCNPQLHVLGLPSPHKCLAMSSARHVDCGCCAQGLHPASTAPGHFSLCGHGEAEQCGQPALHARPDKCPCSPACDLPHTWMHLIP